MSMVSSPQHAFACSGSAKAAATRHKAINNALLEILRALPNVPLHVVREAVLAAEGVALEHPDRGTINTDHRCDAYVWLLNSSLRWFIDISVTYPNPAQLPAAATKALAAAEARSLAKIRHYQRHYLIGTNTPTSLVPAVMESPGTFHPEFERLLQQLSLLAFPRGPDPDGPGDDIDGLRALFMTSARQRLTAALVRGTEPIFRRWVNLCVRGNGGGSAGGSSDGQASGSGSLQGASTAAGRAAGEVSRRVEGAAQWLYEMEG
ncbi:hypothetical protein DFJ74DRAFT_712535 [Hyaloraphidium curvatum]|nr:hypothetical protein DFJ74DRAFT_712535 [Hyaloraphidium curvatum]